MRDNLRPGHSAPNAEATIRDLVLLAILCGIVPMVLRAPVIGLLAWLWIALMNPNREVYGFLHGAPLNLYLAILTAGAWLVSRDRKTISPTPFTVFLLLFLGWATISTFYALDRTQALPIWERTAKTFILAIAVTMLGDSRVRLQAIIWIIAVSLGYYAVKGGGFTLLSGGHSRVFGPESSMIEDNNALGLALVMLLPLLNYLRLTSARPLIRTALLGSIGLTLVAVLGTYSRGALIALGAAALVYAARTRHGILVFFAGAVLLLTLPSFLPSGWSERMSSISTYDQDSSFQGRLEAWQTSVNIALARPFIGGGFLAVEQTWIAKAYSSPGSLQQGRAAHSVYFQVLGETGFVGLLLYLAVVGAAIANTFSVLAAARDRPELLWANQLARMLQVSIAAFLTGGAALSMAYYDGAIVILALTAALRQVVSNLESSRLPVWKAERSFGITSGAR